MSTTISLYVKIHNKTGLKYLGKTIKQNVAKYPGSGIFWKNHIKKHGNDVTTYILFQSTNIKEIEKMGLYFSNKFDVVKSKNWANLVEETGKGVGLKGPQNGMYGKTHTLEVRNKLSQIASRSKGKTYEERYGVEKAKKLKKIRSLSMQGKDNKAYKNPRYDKTMFEFFNKDTKETFIGTRYEFYTKFNLPKSSVHNFIKGKINNYNGWEILH